ncbi:MAG: DNA topoisomerase IV [Flavobacteriales bacterium]
MKRLLLLLLLCCLQSCYQIERNCVDFKTGTFEFKKLVGTEIQTTTFVRNDSIEIDYYKGRADTSSIRWINDCEYIVKNRNPKKMSEKDPIHMKILTTTEMGYTFEFNIVGKSKKQQGTVTKIKD